MEKTDLKKILSVSGQRGLFLYLSQARNGVIVESLETKQRTTFGSSAKISSMADISVYTTSEDVSLKEIFTGMAQKLQNGPAMSSKEDPKKIKAFFREVLPEYDEDRFYVSHMKKILEWYNLLQKFASLEFVEEEEEEEAETEETPSEETPSEEA
ncbi:MAG: DUF5606 domain-containing protein [Bacteroidales bacterium]|nr:DUF5606 domain-containing protein [Bacteroidales bacterium]